MVRGIFIVALLLPLAAALAQAPGAGNLRVRGGPEALYVAGGIGEAEQAALAAREKDFNLKLVFTLVQGNFVSDVAVAIHDATGRALVEHVAPGPILLARLAPGRYRVTATHEGRAVTRDVAVAAGRLRTEYLRWPANPAQDLPVSRWTERE